ncbi:MAG TPA: hypothetical protein VKE49_00450 [Myxococcaceae bacterium]|nr:hypothetical protein [Myxococcaceae bacterium]
MIRNIAAALLGGVICLGCQHGAAGSGSEPSAAKSAGFQPTGAIVFARGSASFDANRVAGPRINVTKRSDGTWAGTLDDQIVDVTVNGNRLVGSFMTMSVEQSSNGVLITGQWLGRILRFQVTPDQVVVRTPNRSLTLNRKGEGEYGPGGELRLSGEAALLNPPMPQFALAMAATF